MMAGAIQLRLYSTARKEVDENKRQARSTMASKNEVEQKRL